MDAQTGGKNKIMIQKNVVINAASGLHARPASQLVSFAQKYDGEAKIHFSGKQGNLKSILHVLALGVPKDSEVIVEVAGEGEEKFAEDLVNFIANLKD